MSENNKPITVAEFFKFTDGLTAKLNEMIKHINHIHKRLDDIDRRLDILEGRSKTMEGDISTIKVDVHEVKNETRLIPPIIDAFKMDGVEIVNLKTRVGDLEKRSGGEHKHG